MSEAQIADEDEQLRSRRPPHAVVGSQVEREELFGKAFDPRIVRRIWAFAHPYRFKIYLSVAAVLVFTITQLAIPLIIGLAIDNGMTLNIGRPLDDAQRR